MPDVLNYDIEEAVIFTAFVSKPYYFLLEIVFEVWHHEKLWDIVAVSIY